MLKVSRRQQIPRLSPSALSSTERWQAITARDATVNTFVYAVLTTKIYCRPSCPARLARRANVQFYDTPSQAEKAGFRACKRCRPHSGLTAAQSNPQIAVVEKACESIRNILAEGLKPKLGDLAAQAGLTSSHFHRVFKKHVGVTPGQYVGSLAQSNLRSPDSMSSTWSDGHTPRSGSLDSLDGNGVIMELNEAGDKGAGTMVPDFPGSFDAWNEFDDLLAFENGQMWVPEVGSIDPRILSASD